MTPEPEKKELGQPYPIKKGWTGETWVIIIALGLTFFNSYMHLYRFVINPTATIISAIVFFIVWSIIGWIVLTAYRFIRKKISKSH